MEHLLGTASAYTDLAFLRVLQLVHQQATLLVEDLKAYELPSIVPKSPAEADMNRSFNTTPGATTATSASVTQMLETAMEELFVPYTEGQRYLERESKSLGYLYSSYLVNFTRYHVR
jgi:exocyst complex component 5